MSRKFRGGIILLILLAIVAGNILLHRSLRNNYSKIRQFDVLETLPTAPVAKMLWLELDSLAADYYYLKGIQHFGTHKYMKKGHPLLYPVLDLATDMDPYFAKAYTFGGLCLNLMGMDYSKDSALLYKGLKYLPDNYQIAYLLGFNLYFFEHKYAEAATILFRAAKSPEAPEFIGPLATRLASEGGSPEMGLVFIEEILPTIEDETMLADYHERRNLLIMEIALNKLQAAVEMYKQLRGETPTDVNQLLSNNLIDEIPAEPFGGKYKINEEGLVYSTSAKERLKLSDKAKINMEND